MDYIKLLIRSDEDLFHEECVIENNGMIKVKVGNKEMQLKVDIIDHNQIKNILVKNKNDL